MKVESIALALIVAAIALPATADELNLPSRKPGEWQIAMQIAGHSMAIQQCVDAATDKEMMQSSFAQTGAKCSSVNESQNGNTITIDATCSLASGMVTKTHAVITGDFQSAYTVDAISDTTGGPANVPKHSEIKQDVSWVGACPAGTSPGDITMPGMPQLPGGLKLNLKQLQSMGGGG